MAAYGRTAQLGGVQQQNSPTRDLRAANERDTEDTRSAAAKREEVQTLKNNARDTRPPERAARQEEGERREAAPQRGTYVDIAV